MDYTDDNRVTLTDEDRVILRREAYDFNENLMDLADKLDTIDNDAATAVKLARAALFEAWTILCAPPEDEDDH